MKHTVKIQAVSPLLGTAVDAPQYATPGSAGMDLRACIDRAQTIAPGERALIPTGIAIELPSAELVALVCARSGLAIRHGIALANGVGVIDSDYRGEIQVGLINQSGEAYTIEPGERIAQMLIRPVCPCALTLSGALGETERGAGGFGSTGRQ